ncbi:MAG: methyl-accepting chemotaxis protein [Kineothrix sp.]
MERANSRKKRHGYGPRIKFQLIGGFAVPILILIVVGRLTYQRAGESLTANFEDATLSSISMGSRYLDFGFETAMSEALQLTMNSDLAAYAYGSYRNKPVEGNLIYNKMQSSITVKQASNTFVEGIYIIPLSGSRVMSHRSGDVDGFYEEWAESAEGQALRAGSSNYTWMGTHPFADERLNIVEDDYAVSYVGILSNKSACVIMDINKAAILDSLKSLSLGKGSVAAFITADGREITYHEREEGNLSSGLEKIVFSNEEFCRSFMDAEETLGSGYVEYMDTEYLFMYGKSQVNGSMLCAMVPKSAVIKGARDMKVITDWMVVLACIVVGIIEIAIFSNIAVSMGRITKKLNRAAEGDLTVELLTGGKSELSHLAKNIMEMVRHTRKLIQKVRESLTMVQGSSERVAEVSDRMWENAESISGAVKEIDAGVSDQSVSIQNCACMMEQLSERIQIINKDVDDVGRFTDSTKEMISRGILTINELSSQARATSEITEKVQDNVGMLEEESSKIRSFVDTINEISGQTNLLSLNASIEAARAGQAGRGFSVVAGEIQKLAEESMRAAGEIEKVVVRIRQRMGDTVDAAGNAKDVVSRQTRAVEETKEVFDNISKYMEQLLSKLKDISQNVKSADEGRLVTMEAIDSISAASVETAACSSVVNKTVDSQMQSANTLRESAAELESNMRELTEVLEVFKV